MNWASGDLCRSSVRRVRFNSSSKQLNKSTYYVPGTILLYVPESFKCHSPYNNTRR